MFFIIHFESFHISLFNYCTYNLNHPEKWESTFDSAYEYIAKEYSLHTQPEYISKYFYGLHGIYTQFGDVMVRQIVSNQNEFCDNLKKRTQKYV